MIDDRKTLNVTIDEFEATLRRSASLADDDFEGRKREAIELRRKIAEQRNAITSQADEALAGSSLHAFFRSRFSNLCAAIARHQASWPVSSIALANTQYRSSISTVREEYDAFFRWARQSLGSKPASIKHRQKE